MSQFDFEVNFVDLVNPIKIECDSEVDFFDFAEPVKIECDYCDEILTTKNQRRTHHLIHKGMGDTIKVNLQLVGCPHCDQRFPSFNSVGSHVRFDHKELERPFDCPEENCRGTFITQSALKTHLKLHRKKNMLAAIAPDSRMFACKLCLKEFESFQGLSQHFRMRHSGRDPVDPAVQLMTSIALDNAQLHQEAQQQERAQLRQEAKQRERAQMNQEAQHYKQLRLHQEAQLCKQAQQYQQAQLRDEARLREEAQRVQEQQIFQGPGYTLFPVPETCTCVCTCGANC